MTAALPTGLLYGTVRWTVIGVAEDSADVGDLPDPELINGKVTFTPVFDALKYVGTAEDPNPRTVLPRVYTYDIVGGLLVDKEGRTDIKLVACDSPATSPQGWQYRVDYQLNDGYTFGGFYFTLLGGTIVDLTVAQPEEVAPGVFYLTGPQGDPGPGYGGGFVMAPVDPGQPLALTVTSDWGIDSSGVVYYNSAGAAPGEDALIVPEILTGEFLAFRPGQGELDNPDSSVRLALNEMYQPRPTVPTIMAIGDSITASGGYQVDPATLRPEPVVGTLSYMWHAHLLSRARFEWLGTAATGGFDPQQILDIHVPTVLKVKPTYCVVLSGQNNKYQLTQIQQTWETLLAGGVTPILCTNVPTGGYGDVQDVKLNQFIRRYAIEHGLPLVDFNAALVNPADGYFRVGESGDNVHPTELGHRIMGQALADVLDDLIPTPALDLIRHHVPNGTTSAYSGVTVPNPLFLEDNGNTPPVPLAWGLLTPCQTALGTDAACVGRKFTITSSVDSNAVASCYPENIIPGHRYQFSAIIGASVESVGAFWWLRLVDGITGAFDWTYRGSVDVPFGAAFQFLWTAPTVLDHVEHRFDIGIDTAVGGSISIAQFTFRDLTALGL